MTTHLHGDVVDVEFLAVRGSDSELHILVRRLVDEFRPGTAFSCADHDTLLSVIAIFHQSLNFGGSGGGTAVYHSIVIAGQ